MAGALAPADCQMLMHRTCRIDTTLEKMHRKAKNTGRSQLVSTIEDALRTFNGHPHHPDNRTGDKTAEDGGEHEVSQTLKREGDEARAQLTARRIASGNADHTQDPSVYGQGTDLRRPPPPTRRAPSLTAGGRRRRPPQKRHPPEGRASRAPPGPSLSPLRARLRRRRARPPPAAQPSQPRTLPARAGCVALHDMRCAICAPGPAAAGPAGGGGQTVAV
eukprot:scaffold442_cov397-Prasinococcus_capsulatus_cf.AAC.24